MHQKHDNALKHINLRDVLFNILERRDWKKGFRGIRENQNRGEGGPMLPGVRSNRAEDVLGGFGKGLKLSLLWGYCSPPHYYTRSLYIWGEGSPEI